MCATGDQVTIQTDAYPDTFHGRISYVAAALDPTTRTLTARIETQNPGGKLKKDMYVTTIVQAGKIQNVIAVPDSAVLRDNENQPFVYAEVSANQFGRRPVTIGESQQGTDSDYGRVAVRRSGYRRRQPVSAVRQHYSVSQIEERRSGHHT